MNTNHAPEQTRPTVTVLAASLHMSRTALLLAADAIHRSIADDNPKQAIERLKLVREIAGELGDLAGSN